MDAEALGLLRGIHERVDGLHARLDCIEGTKDAELAALRSQNGELKDKATALLQESHDGSAKLQAAYEKLQTTQDSLQDAQKQLGERDTELAKYNKAACKGKLGEEIALDMLEDFFRDTGVKVYETAKEGHRGDFVLAADFLDPPLRVMVDMKNYDTSPSISNKTFKLSDEAARDGCRGMIVLYRKTFLNKSELTSLMGACTEGEFRERHPDDWRVAHCRNVANKISSDAAAALNPDMCFVCTIEAFQHTFTRILAAHRKLELAANPDLFKFQAAAAQLVRADHDFDQTLLYHLNQTKLGDLRAAKKDALVALKRKCEQHDRRADVQDLLAATNLYEDRYGKPAHAPGDASCSKKPKK